MFSKLLLNHAARARLALATDDDNPVTHGLAG